MASSVRSTESYYKGGKNKALNLTTLNDLVQKIVFL